MRDDIASRLFSESFESAVANGYEALPPSPLYFDPPGPVHYGTRMSWDSLYAEPAGSERRNRWWIRCLWDGSVTIWLEVWSEPDDAHLYGSAVIEDAVRPMARVATSLLRGLGAFGRAHAQLRFDTGGFRIDGGPGPKGFPAPTMKAWTGWDGEIDEEQIARWERELLRSAGFKAYEPEPAR